MDYPLTCDDCEEIVGWFKGKDTRVKCPKCEAEYCDGCKGNHLPETKPCSYPEDAA